MVLSLERSGRAPQPDNEEGSSLIEAVITFGLLASVLLASLGLFMLGERQLGSARSASRAFAAARGILEEMNGWSYREIWGRFGLDGASSLYVVDSRTSAAAAEWQASLSSELPSAFATVRIESLRFELAPEAVSTAKGLRVVVTVEWDEGGRHRTVRLCAVRF